MEQSYRLGENKLKRPIRNKKHNRRIFGEERRPHKKLFTPEIKKYLKDWLVRRRENPYPNREEKKSLAVQTGLTYIQICNWFANWRRKLKNAGKDPRKRTWGDLIKTYNNQAQGNIEHFSIGSDDSIWDEDEMDHSYDSQYDGSVGYDHQEYNNNNSSSQNQCHYISSTSEIMQRQLTPFSQNPTYSLELMEKYMQDVQSAQTRQSQDTIDESKPSMIAKWLQSAEKFKPNEDSYLDWTFTKIKKKKTAVVPKSERDDLILLHGKEELAAAEALTTLANSSRQIQRH